MITLSSAPCYEGFLRKIVSDQWFAWRPVKTPSRTVWLDWVWRVRDLTTGAVRYFPCNF